MEAFVVCLDLESTSLNSSELLAQEVEPSENDESDSASVGHSSALSNDEFVLVDIEWSNKEEFELNYADNVGDIVVEEMSTFLSCVQQSLRKMGSWWLNPCSTLTAPRKV